MQPNYYTIAEITIQVTSDLPITETSFSKKFLPFCVDGAGPDTVTIHHHFALPDLKEADLGEALLRRAPWAIYQRGVEWIYLGIAVQDDDPTLHRVAIFSQDYSRAEIYHPDTRAWQKGGSPSLTLFPSDQILIARLLADRQGCYLHSAGAIINDAGMLFVGHSDAGKSTTTRMLMEAGAAGKADIEILCDDRNIVRKHKNGWRVYGTWSHGDIAQISPAGAPLRAVCFLEQAKENRLIPLTDRAEIARRLLATLIKPHLNVDWWQKTFETIEQLAYEGDFYIMRFDKSSAIVDELQLLTETI